MKLWQTVWRQGFARILSTPGLKALAEALRADSPQLIQGATTTPPPLLCVMDWPVEAACAVAYCGWKGDCAETVGDVEEVFAKACYEADLLLGEPGACRHLLNWYDDTPRDEMRRELLEEVGHELAWREFKEAVRCFSKSA
jgi:hypothetical protein